MLAGSIIYYSAMGCCSSRDVDAGVLRDASNRQHESAATARPAGGFTCANRPGAAVGNTAIPHHRRVSFRVFFPEESRVQPLYMFFDREKPGSNVLEAACSHVGLKLDRGRLVRREKCIHVPVCMRCPLRSCCSAAAIDGTRPPVTSSGAECR